MYQEMSAEAPVENLATLIDSLVKASNDISNRHKEMSRTLRRLATDIEREQKRAVKGKARTRKPTQQKSVVVNKPMSEFMTKNAGEEKSDEGRWTRHQMQRVICRYIREHKLTVADDNKKWVPDATLVKALGLTKGEKYSYMIVNGLLSKVIVPSAQE
jgi:hypothetical protein